ncbi:hypothetical protein [Pseudomonas sp.]|jgi:hypothetical protein|uniref:hypothetical protein n=1 Tax=unclassified Pseudomonas TaxID=196821 RepID=UPI003340561F
MTDRTDEQLIVQAAREWAARSNKDAETVVGGAQEVMAALKDKLTPIQYENALSDLLRQYNNQ